MVERIFAYSTTGKAAELPVVTGLLRGFFPCGGVGEVTSNRVVKIMILGVYLYKYIESNPTIPTTPARRAVLC